MKVKAVTGVSQAWIEPISEDPSALSALAVARDRLLAARALTRLKRFRVIELTGALPEPSEQRVLMHRSTQFYNPHKERLHLRTRAADASPPAPGEPAILVIERGGERRAAAERWWLQETGSTVEVREGVAWVLAFESQEDGGEAARELMLLRDRRHGLFCNPHSQDARIAVGEVPLPWLGSGAAGARGDAA